MLLANGGTRTHDLHFTKVLLYQLSYIGIARVFLVGGGGFEPPKAEANRFTVCPR